MFECKICFSLKFEVSAASNLNEGRKQLMFVLEEPQNETDCALFSLVVATHGERRSIRSPQTLKMPFYQRFLLLLTGQHSQGFIRLMNTLKSSLCICGLTVLLRAFSFYYILIYSLCFTSAVSSGISKVHFIVPFLGCERRLSRAGANRCRPKWRLTCRTVQTSRTSFLHCETLRRFWVWKH